MARRTDLLPALMVALLLLACAAAVVTLLAVGKEAASTFPGKNGKIAFVRTPGGDPGWEDIYTMSPHGQGVKRLTNYPQEDLEPAWSPDGSKIAFMSFRGNLGVWTTYTLYTMNANGTGVERLIKNPRDDHEPAWSPDGSKIAFARYSDGEDEIYTVNADGTGLKRLTNNPKEDSAPTWSPDGNRIAFHSKRDGNYEIYTIKPNGTGIGAPNQKHCTRPRACVVSGRQQDSLRERPRRQEAVPYVFMLRDLHHERQRHECGAPHQQYCGRL